MFLHLATVVPCVFLGAIVFVIKKGTLVHRRIGRIYMILMMATATTTLFMPAVVGPRLLDHFGFIHLFSVLTLFSVPRAYFAIRRGDTRTHQISMISLYAGAIVIAGAFTFMPGRYLHSLIFGMSALGY
ncbi:DUF2306 domain-containing protein [Aporhodopirellula rubra]|nr:DUF2306 domain-containing protein [Aporhodopirellula rubra]